VTARQQRRFVPWPDEVFCPENGGLPLCFVDGAGDPAQSSLKSDRGSAGAPGRKRAIPLDRVRAWRRGLNAVAEHFR